MKRETAPHARCEHHVQRSRQVPVEGNNERNLSHKRINMLPMLEGSTEDEMLLVNVLLAATRLVADYQIGDHFHHLHYAAESISKVPFTQPGNTKLTFTIKGRVPRLRTRLLTTAESPPHPNPSQDTPVRPHLRTRLDRRELPLLSIESPATSEQESRHRRRMGAREV